ncbi:MAG: Glu/Leu/Phe/Val dehydrogenase dimerization domain-containing protein [Thermoplasmata archaeon]
MASPGSWSFDVNGHEAFVVVNRWANDLAAGGLRFSPEVTLAEVERLALTMTRKWAILELPFGGAKLGIRGDPERTDKYAVLRAFGNASQEVVRDRVVTGPDLGTTSRDITVFYEAVGQDPYHMPADRLRSLGFHPTPRPRYTELLRDLGERSTGLAVTRAALKAWEGVHPSGEPPTVSIQGYGSVGRTVAEEMVLQGARVLSVADAEGCLRHPEGLTVDALRGPKPGIMNRAHLPPRTEEAPREAWMEWDSDLLIPASIPDAINRENVGQVKTRMIVEAANIPVHEDVQDELHRRGVFVLPDFLVNGGAAASYGLLLVQQWRRKGDLLREVFRRIVGATELVVDRSLRDARNPREVAIELAEARLTPPGPPPP